ncbi:MAG: hypothetical protein K2W95_23725 [Candidatus Obscuribacterales bacterium]|nr:hypothetical protein [Candidatus Obscuribacterales bacterium]
MRDPRELYYFADWLNEAGMSRHTVRNYVSRLRGFLNYVATLDESIVSELPFHSPLPINLSADALISHLPAYLAHCKSVGLRQSSLKDISAATDNFFQCYYGITFGTASNKLRTEKTLKDNDCQLLLDHLRCCQSKKVKLIFFLIIYEGLLPSDCSAINLGDLIFEDERTDLLLTRNQRQRKISLCIETEIALIDWLEQRSDLSSVSSDAIITSASGTRISTGGIDYLIRSTGHRLKLFLSARLLRYAASAQREVRHPAIQFSPDVSNKSDFDKQPTQVQLDVSVSILP